MRNILWIGAVAALAAVPAAAQTLSTRLVASGLDRPCFVTSPPGDASRLFVVETNTGLVKVVVGGTVLPTPFLDVGVSFGGGDERGLLGMAFHPDYATSGRFYVKFTDGTGSTYIREYTVSPDPNVADPGSLVTIFGPLVQPFPDHCGGCLQFGPDGMLWVGQGDGGGPFDPGNRAQDLTTYFGKMLRFDVDNPPTYVPADNPYLATGDGIPDLIWSRGFRNPWRYSFDRLTGELYIGDVGQFTWEEISVQPAGSTGGENFGWRCMESLHCTGLSGCTCNDPSLILPIKEYAHSTGGCAVIGGCVYRGSFIPGLQGTYFYADYCMGKVWSLRYSGGVVTDFQDRTAELDPPGPVTFDGIVSFGEDANGEMYIVDISEGAVYRIETACPSPVGYCVTSPNTFGPGAVMSSSGSTSLFLEDFVLRTTGLPPNTVGVYFYGSVQTQTPFGHGFLCIDQPVFRVGASFANGLGQASHTFAASSPPGVIDLGEVWNFQYWYRNTASGPPFFNLSDGLSATFCP